VLISDNIRRRLASRVALIIHLCAMLLVVDGFVKPANAAHLVVRGVMTVDWNDLITGRQLTHTFYTFNAAVSSNRYLLKPLVVDNTNGVAEYVNGGDGSESFKLSMLPSGRGVGAISLFPQFAPGHDVVLGGMLLWMAYVAQPMFSQSPVESFYMATEAPLYYPNEILYQVERHAEPPRLPSRIKATSPTYFYDGMAAWKSKRRSPMLAPYRDGKLLWEFQVVTWTNIADGTYPLELQYSRFAEYQSLPAVKHSEALAAVIVDARGYATQFEVVSNLIEMPQIIGAIPTVDYRFVEILGPLPARYYQTNELRSPTSDQRLRTIASHARALYYEQADYAPYLPAKRTATYIFIVIMALLPFALVLVNKLRRRSQNTTNKPRHI